MIPIKLTPVTVDELKTGRMTEKGIQASVLRLDKLHPEISGNKWFKLKEYIHQAKLLHKTAIITFGGAYSNHILATAAACNAVKLASVGIIRGEKPETLSPTLAHAQQLGMELFFTSREEYKEKKIPQAVQEQYADAYVVNEGGYGIEGMLGAKTILKELDATPFTHIMAAVGTGTTLAGLIEACWSSQQVIGVSALKNNFDLELQINALLSPQNQNRFRLLHQFHFGGYAKYNEELIAFMNEWYRQTELPSDFVYTAKLFYAFHQLCAEGFFAPNSNVLLIHSGGLQGNLSLNKGTLIFH